MVGWHGVFGDPLKSGNPEFRFPSSGWPRLYPQLGSREAQSKAWFIKQGEPKRKTRADFVPPGIVPSTYSVCIGYMPESPEKNERPLSDVLHWEKV
jgi:hypothetical protein